MATSLDISKKRSRDSSSARRVLSCVKIAAIGPGDAEILDEICQFLAVSYHTFTNELCQLWSYCTEFHEVFTRYRPTGIICAVNARIEVAISHSVSECQSDENGEFAIFFAKSVAMATSLEISKKRSRSIIDEKNAKISPADPEIICL